MKSVFLSWFGSVALLAAPVAVVIAFAAPGAVHAQDAETSYWVSLSKDRSNMRVGPGREYRINWVYVRRGLPMKVLRVMGPWRLVQDPDGARGWMLQQFLTRNRTGMVKGGTAEIREDAEGRGRLLWRAASGVVGKIGDCENGWCDFDVDGRKGYVEARKVWGAEAP